MKFWDSSALVPLLVRQPQTNLAKKRWENDPHVVLWTMTSVEAAAAVARLVREGLLTNEGGAQAERSLDELVAAADIVFDVDAVKSQARRLLRVHALRAADALQLAAAVTWAQGRPEGLGFYSFDDRLLVTASKEGFDARAD